MPDPPHRVRFLNPWVICFPVLGKYALSNRLGCVVIVNGLGQRLNGLGRCLNGLGRCINGLGRCLNGLGRCINGLGRCFNGLCRCLNGLGRCLNGLGRCLNGSGNCRRQWSWRDFDSSNVLDRIKFTADAAEAIRGTSMAVPRQTRLCLPLPDKIEQFVKKLLKSPHSLKPDIRRGC